MDRTPPRNVGTWRYGSGQSSSAHPQGSGQLHPDVRGEDSSNSATSQPNTPSPRNTSKVLMLILEQLDKIDKQLKDHDERIEDIKRDMDTKM